MRNRRAPLYFLAFLMLLSLIPACAKDQSIRYYNLGLDAAKREDYEEAVRLWTESLRYRPDDADALYNLGLALVTLKRYTEAEAPLRKAVALDPQDCQTQQVLGKSLEEQGKLTEAKLSYESSINLKPTYVPALIGLASVALKEEQNKTAEKYSTQAVELDPNNLEANMLLSEAYFRNEEYNAAYGQILAAQKLGPAKPDLLVLLGKVEYEKRMYNDALETLGAARAIGVSSDEIFLYLGLSNLALGYTSDAESAFKLSLFKNDKNTRAWTSLGETYIRARKWREAGEAITHALSLAPDDPQAALDEAVIALNTGDLSSAVQKLERLRNRQDAPQLTNYYLGHAYLGAGNTSGAREAFQRFVDTWQGEAALSDEAKSIVGRLAP